MDNKTVSFPINTLKRLEPELIRCFGIDHTDFNEELINLFTSEFVLCKDGKPHVPADYSKDELPPEEYAWGHTEHDLTILVPDSSNLNVAQFLEQFLNKKKKGDMLAIQILELLTLVHYRNSRVVMTDWDAEVEDYYKYARFIRPDMLKLYIALNTDTKSKGEQVRISLHNNPPIHLDNFEQWFETVLSRYLDRYLGVTSVGEAQQELDEIYGKKKGKRFDNKLATEYM